MKTIQSFLLTSFLFATVATAEPFMGTIEATISGHQGGGKVEYLTNGKMMLIRQAGEGFKRASGLVDLTRDFYTHLQHHNHTFTEVGKLSEWHKIAENPDHPAPPRQGEPLQVTATAEKRNLLGREVQKITVEGHGQTLEIWGCQGLPAFYSWFAFCPEPFNTGEPEEQIGAICRERNVFPLLITRKLGETTATLFEVTKITSVKAEQKDHPALAEQTYTIPASHRLMPHPLQEMQRMRAEMEQTNQTQTK